MIDPIPIAFIVGNGYSGSTLIDMILGSNSQAVGVGELRDFDRLFSEERLVCACGKPGPECEFWLAVLAWLREHEGKPDFRLLPPDASAEQILENRRLLYRAVQAVSGKRIIVDSSKQANWAKGLPHIGGISPQIIHLVRDGRAVARAWLKRGKSFGFGALHWKETNRAIRRWLAEPGAPPSVELRYEDFCADPESGTRSLCERLGLPWEPAMLRFWERARHNVSGSYLRLERAERPIVADEAWRKTITREELDLFGLLAGEALAEFGYK